MKLSAIYDFFIKQGIATDLRSRSVIEKKLREQKRAFSRLSRLEQKFFDKESLKNPYADTRILHGNLKKEIKRILVGIDLEAPEILLADRLCEKGQPIDLCLAHHPEGIALAGLNDVMALQKDLLQQIGLSDSVAGSLMDKRIQEVSRSLHSGNHNRSVDAARLMGMAYMCCHTASDNHVAKYLQNTMDRIKPKTLKDVIRLLLREPEYQNALGMKCGPKIIVGDEKKKAGKIIVDMTGGTEGSKEVFARISQAGVNTLLCMHLSEGHYNRVKQEHINVIIAGHIASDNLGINLLLDKLEKKDSFEFIECSGFKRVKRR